MGAWAVLCFLVGLLCLILGITLAGWLKLWSLATGGMIVFTTILSCSVQPWYGKHAALGDGGSLDIHQHSFWEIGHVH